MTGREGGRGGERDGRRRVGMREGGRERSDLHLLETLPLLQHNEVV